MYPTLTYAGQGKWEDFEKTRRPTAPSGTILTCEHPGAALPGIEPEMWMATFAWHYICLKGFVGRTETFRRVICGSDEHSTLLSLPNNAERKICFFPSSSGISSPRLLWCQPAAAGRVGRPVWAPTWSTHGRGNAPTHLCKGWQWLLDGGRGRRRGGSRADTGATISGHPGSPTKISPATVYRRTPSRKQLPALSLSRAAGRSCARGDGSLNFVPLHNRELLRHNGNTARLARRSDKTLGVRVSVARIAPSLLDPGAGSHELQMGNQLYSVFLCEARQVYTGFGSRIGRKAVQCWDTEIVCAQPARSIYLNFSICCKPPLVDLESGQAAGNEASIDVVLNAHAVMRHDKRSVGRAARAVGDVYLRVVVLQVGMLRYHESIDTGVEKGIERMVSIVISIPVSRENSIATPLLAGSRSPAGVMAALICRPAGPRTLASHQSEPDSIPGQVTEFSQVGIVSDDAVGRRVFSGISRLPRPFISAPLHIHFSHD
ncbi:hypothetical protein PR048_030487 [Dryococelus australis]|uniref:Uncharacterized protein n=1 Tax=Dryococelus australis TaxID=614101 RepID=A0ABQ9GBP8_9NEOP|nr:hypothetical protein PR048_030487 [Dryococelus australis]